MSKVVKDKWGIKLKYPTRSCIECGLYPCFENMQRCKCNFAKYGCKLWLKNGKI